MTEMDKVKLETICFLDLTSAGLLVLGGRVFLWSLTSSIIPVPSVFT